MVGFKLELTVSPTQRLLKKEAVNLKESKGSYRGVWREEVKEEIDADYNLKTNKQTTTTKPQV